MPATKSKRLREDDHRITMPPEDWAYAARLAAERKRLRQSNATVSGVLRLGLHGMRALRHDVAVKRNALMLAAEGLRTGTVAPAEAAGMLRRISDEMGELLEPVGAA